MKKYKVSGMSCAACSAKVEKAVKKVDGVVSVSVNLLTGDMAVDGGEENAVIQAVLTAGYGITSDGMPKSEQKQSDTKKIAVRLIVSAVVLLMLTYMSMGVNMWNFPLPKTLKNAPVAVGIIQMLLSTIVLVINQRFFVSGTKALVRLSPNMDTLVSLGSAVSYIYSAVRLIIMATTGATQSDLHGLYFESASMILVLITVGKLLESIAKGKTTDAIKKLIALTPSTATVIRDGKEVVIPANEVNIGDTFIVRAGDKIPVDGVVTDGNGYADESMLTGESVAVEKLDGKKVYSATILSSGYIKCKAEKVGEQTAFAEIIKMVQDASSGKAPIAKVADKVSGIFVPVVMGIALITLTVWLLLGQGLPYALEKGVSILVISCPCALGLATPVAIMVGSGVGARNKILYKTAESLESAGRVKTVLLDKTGTITYGKPIVTEVIASDETLLLTVANALEKKSNHPLAKAITEHCEKLSLPQKEVENFSTHIGGGVSGVIDGKAVTGGSVKFVSQTLTVSDEVKSNAETLALQGKTPVLFECDGKLLGLIALRDEVKADAKNAVQRLKDMGVKVVMLTGDNERTAKAIASEVGIDDVISSVLPDEKAKVVEKAKENGFVAMVGDGINDAVALTTADVGIAIGAGTDVAIDSADVVLSSQSLLGVTNAIKLGKKTLRNIKQNLFWAFIYNIICIPIAGGALVPLGISLNPMIGAGAMSLSSLFVVGNALRLNLYKAEKINENKEKIGMEKVYKVEGMMCPHCEARAKQAVEAIDGVLSATPSHKKKRIKVVFENDEKAELVKSAIEQAGYKFIG